MRRFLALIGVGGVAIGVALVPAGGGASSKSGTQQVTVVPAIREGGSSGTTSITVDCAPGAATGPSAARIDVGALRGTGDAVGARVTTPAGTVVLDGLDQFATLSEAGSGSYPCSGTSTWTWQPLDETGEDIGTASRRPVSITSKPSCPPGRC